MAQTLKQFSQDEIKPDEIGHFKHHFSFTMELENHPLMMAMGAVALFLVLVYLYSHIATKGNTSSTSTTNTTPNLTPYTIDIITPGTTGTQSPTTNPVTCQEGYHWDSTKNACVPNTVPTPQPPPPSNLVTVVAIGALSSIYGGVHNGGRDIMTLHPGNKVSILAGPVSWGYDNYYQVSYNGTLGWTRGHTIGK
jgi:hypothetical protein